MKMSKYLKRVLPSTDLRPHISIAIDKPTPHRDANHAILAIMPVDGKSMAILTDAPIVYDTVEGSIEGGSGEDVADQVATFKVLELKYFLCLTYLNQLTLLISDKFVFILFKIAKLGKL